MTTTQPTTVDARLRARAARVVPGGGMYGHQSVASLPPGFPQFLERAEGCRTWDVDGNEYIDFLCSYGPVVLGHRDPEVEAAADRQRALGDCLDGPSPRLVELAELLVDTVAHADWAMFAKNGTDATTMCVTIARAATGRRKVLVAAGAYHGAAPWCTPRLNGVVAEDRAHLLTFRYNDLPSVEAAAELAGDDLAAVVVSPFRHDARFDQELVDPAFAAGVRALCDTTGAALVIDEVRGGLRLHLAGSWEAVGVRPDLSAWSKAIANGHPLAAVLGSDRFREAAGAIYATGSFWFSAVAMAAALATVRAVRDRDAIGLMERAGARLRAGLAAQASAHGFEVNQTGPVQMPFLTFCGDRDLRWANAWTDEAVRRGVYLHPWHNWFLCAAHTDADIDDALGRTDDAFAATRRQLGLP